MVLVGALSAWSWLAWLGVFAAVLIGSDIARRWRWVACGSDGRPRADV